ncbi:MAG: hypothetical protein KDA97_01015 [Acidimicrobiales bacterium]|nr:hypothetical protein [Acidimicrobiales bacterium]
MGSSQTAVPTASRLSEQLAQVEAHVRRTRALVAVAALSAVLALTLFFAWPSLTITQQAAASTSALLGGTLWLKLLDRRAVQQTDAGRAAKYADRAWKSATLDREASTEPEIVIDLTDDATAPLYLGNLALGLASEPDPESDALLLEAHRLLSELRRHHPDLADLSDADFLGLLRTAVASEETSLSGSPFSSPPPSEP